MTSTALVREGRVVGRCEEANIPLTEIEMATACRTCESRCLLGSTMARRVRVATPPGWEPGVGDRIEVAVAKSELTRSCVLVFGVPLAAWVGGAVLGNHCWGEAGAALSGIAALAGTLLLIGVNRRSLQRWIKIALIPLLGGPASNMPGAPAKQSGPNRTGLKYAV